MQYRLFIQLLLTIFGSSFAMSAQTITDFVASPASLEYFVQESSLVGLGTVVEEHTETKTEMLTTITGKITVEKILVSNHLHLPLSIAFRRDIYSYGLSDQVWGQVPLKEMNGLSVLVFASGSAEKWQLVGLIRLDKATQPGFIEDLVRIFRKEPLGASDITEDLLKEHPVLASYALRKAFSDPGGWATKLTIAGMFFGSTNAALREASFQQTMIALRQCVENDSATGSKLLALALKDLESTNGQSLTNKLADLETLGADSIPKRADWSAATLTALRQKDGQPEKSAQDTRVIKRLTERLAEKNKELK